MTVDFVSHERGEYLYWARSMIAHSWSTQNDLFIFLQKNDRWYTAMFMFRKELHDSVHIFE